MEKEKYTSPELDITEFENADVITTSDNETNWT